MNLEIFEKRLISFYSSWQNNKKDLWGNSDILVMCTSPSHPISSSFFVWLLGYNIPDTIAIFTRDEIYFICMEESLSILNNLENTAMLAVDARVRVSLKDERESGLKTMDQIIHWIRDTEKGWADEGDEIGPLVIGYICNESPKSNLLLCCAFNLMKNDFLSACANGFSQLMNQDRDGTSGKDIQMLNISEEVEHMLLLAPTSKEEKPTKAHYKALSSDEREADFSSTYIIYDLTEKYSYDKGMAGISSVHSLESDEEDEWVLVEA